MADKNHYPVMSQFFRRCFRDNEVARITNSCPIKDGKYWIIEGTKDDGDSSFSLRLSRADYLELLKDAESLPVLTADMKKDLGIEEERPTPPQPPKRDTPKPPPPPPLSTFAAPTECAKTDSTRITDPLAVDLWNQFQGVAFKPHLGKRKLTDAQLADQAAWTEMLKIARSYILAREYVLVRQWIDHLKSQKITFS